MWFWYANNFVTNSTSSPTTKNSGYKCNCIVEEFDWFDKIITELLNDYKNTAVISPVARGASGGLIDKNNNIIDVENGQLTIAYTQP